MQYCNTISNSNTNVQSVISDTLKEQIENINKRKATAIFVQTQFSCMESLNQLPDEIANSSKTISDATKDCMVSGLKNIVRGEIFSTLVLKKLIMIRAKVYKYMTTYGTIISSSGCYIINSQDKKHVRDFLDACINEYKAHLNYIIKNYDMLVAKHKEKLISKHQNPQILNFLISAIPSLDTIKEKNKCSYVFYNEQTISETDYLECSNVIASALESLKERDERFFDKISAPFIEFGKCFNKDTANVLGRKVTSFNNAVTEALFTEQTVTTMLAGTPFAAPANKAYKLLHLLNEKVVKPSTLFKSKDRKNLGDILLKLYKTATYILSSKTTIMDYANDKITFIDDNFYLGQGLQLGYENLGFYNVDKDSQNTSISNDSSAQITCQVETSDSQDNQTVKQLDLFEELSKIEELSINAFDCDKVFTEVAPAIDIKDELFNSLAANDNCDTSIEATSQDVIASKSEEIEQETLPKVDCSVSNDTLASDTKTVDNDLGLDTEFVQSQFTHDLLNEFNILNATEPSKNATVDNNIKEFNLSDFEF